MTQQLGPDLRKRKKSDVERYPKKKKIETVVVVERRACTPSLLVVESEALKNRTSAALSANLFFQDHNFVEYTKQKKQSRSY